MAWNKSGNENFFPNQKKILSILANNNNKHKNLWIILNDNMKKNLTNYK